MQKFLLLFLILNISCFVYTAQSCNNWLNTPSVSSSVSIGDLDVAGNQITVEATINRTQPYLPGGYDDTEGDVVSKHNSPADVNYLLRPNHAAITTTDGFFITPDICDIELNKTYHIALVYDGVTLKFYRDGYLMSQVNATGNLFQNNWNTRFGHYDPAFWRTQFIGFINEVRIWNIARTQTQLKATMNSSLPSPTTQTGLLAYYSFNNLINKQGNNLYNGNLVGAATINASNTSCTFNADSCKAIPASCNNWLATPSNPSYASVGQINITGDKITVEATFNRTTPYSGGPLYAGDLVSKHNTPLDINYLLRPNSAEITTSNGYFKTPDICEIELNKTYHVAMVYDGATLKFYRNGFLMSQIPATGALYQNSWNTRIGWYEPQGFNTNLIGYINEVRIWNIVKTQNELKTYMAIPLPSPTTTAGLVAYYSFDNLANKQGNAAFNGILGGAATINQTNPNCGFIPDSCLIPVKSELIINDYTPVLALDGCKNRLTVEDGTAFHNGDTVLMIQMKGAIVDSSNTASFGSILSYNNAGNYEFNYVKTVTGNTIELLDSLTRNYDIPAGKVQLIRVPYFNTIASPFTLTCLPWDGSKGGVLVLNAKDSISLRADIDVSGKGFRGGNSPNTGSQLLYCFENNYTYPIGSLTAAAKGEGIATIGDPIAWGKGASANAGGSGLGHNSGAGGGSNAGEGGMGGYQLESCGNAPFDNRGIGANKLSYSNADNKVFMGGGGGSGHVDNQGGSDMNGGRGGGIVLINTGYLKANGFSIIAKGGDAPQCTSPPYSVCHDGSGGGGGGGAILVNAQQYINNIPLNVTGGKGGDLSIYNPGAGAGRIGPGGGGGAGLTWTSGTTNLFGLIPPVIDGGNGGVIPADNNNPWGTTPGKSGLNLEGLKMPVDSKTFQKNIDSVKIKDSATSCNRFDFKGLAFTAKYPVNQWQWKFGDGSVGNTQNTSHSFNAAGTFTVWLVITDINGCKDSISTIVTPANGTNSDFAYKQDICNPLSVQFFNIGPVAISPVWSFGDGSTITGNATPTHVYTTAGNYTVRYSNSNGGCTDTVTKTITVNTSFADIITTKDTIICLNTSKQLITIPALNFCWSPTIFLDDPHSPNPVTFTTQPITYYFTAEISGNNLINNGDFSLGNTGFTSAYNFASPNTTEGEYFVGSNPQAWNTSLSSCPDHTNGTGNMMLVNGAPIADVNVWTETITVVPNTNYAFSTWIQALYPPNPAQLSFSINGGTLGSLITASLPTCTWNQFYTTWNSGNNTTATIAILNKNTFVQGNDFALDDISFSPVLIRRDSVKILIDTPKVTATADTTVCLATPVQLNATGAIHYSWTPFGGITNDAIANPIAIPYGNVQYIVSGINANGCTAADTVNITTNALPIITKSADTSICHSTGIRLLAGGGVSYAWTPTSSLSNPAIANPVATPAVSTTYKVKVTDVNHCSSTDSIKVAIRPLPVFGISVDQSVCIGKTASLNASGGNTYLWNPATMVSNAGIANPTTKNNTTTLFTVKIKDNTCNDSTVLSTTVTVAALPIVKAGKSSDIDCVNAGAQLSATGASNYTWSPVTGLNNPNIANPVATITSPQQYLVTGIDALTNCAGTDTITVFIKAVTDPGFFVPNAFSPNGDGINDCFKVTHYGTVKSVDISIYNRYGNLVFHTTNVNECWDGTYKGTPVSSDNYVYDIKTFNDCGTDIKKGNLVLIR
jgi:gliding motility-associated-like protein